MRVEAAYEYGTVGRNPGCLRRMSARSKRSTQVEEERPGQGIKKTCVSERSRCKTHMAFYYLGELNDSLSYTLGVGPLFHALGDSDYVHALLVEAIDAHQSLQSYHIHPSQPCGFL